MVEVTGLAPLAARPGAQPTGLVQFALLLFCLLLRSQTVNSDYVSCAMAAEPFCKQVFLAHVGRSRSRLHPQIPLCPYRKIKEFPKELLYFWS